MAQRRQVYSTNNALKCIISLFLGTNGVATTQLEWQSGRVYAQDTHLSRLSGLGGYQPGRRRREAWRAARSASYRHGYGTREGLKKAAVIEYEPVCAFFLQSACVWVWELLVSFRDHSVLGLYIKPKAGAGLIPRPLWFGTIYKAQGRSWSHS